MQRRTFMAALGGLAGVLVLAGQANAQPKAVVDAAKAAGTVGEQSDGYLGVRGSVDAATKAAVDEINAGRAQLYREAAARNGVTAAVAGAAAFEEVVKAKLRSGEYYRTADGAWVRK